MPIISFWSSGSEHAGKTLSIAAIATYMAIEHNYRILVISTDYNKKDIENCFWKEQKRKISFGLFGPNTSVGLDDGVEGLMKIMKSNKLSPELIKDYTRIVFKDRLEVLPSFKGNYSEYAEIKRKYSDVVNLANGYYDLVLVDLSEHLEDDTIQNILNDSNLIIANISQRLSSIDTFMANREKNSVSGFPYSSSTPAYMKSKPRNAGFRLNRYIPVVTSAVRSVSGIPARQLSFMHRTDSRKMTSPSMPCRTP